MTHQNLKHLAEIIKASKEPINVNLQADSLMLRTQKNTFWILLSVIGIVFSILLLWSYDRGKYNLEIGLVILWISTYGFWRMQNINKTLIFDLDGKTISIIPNFFIHKWVLTTLLNIEKTLPINNLQDLKLILYRNLKYHWTQRIYFKKGIWNIYLFEFEKKETAQQVLNLLKL